MESTSHCFLIRLSILLGLLAYAANARPGRHFHPGETLIFFSSSSHSPYLNPNPNFSIHRSSSSSGGSYFTLMSVDLRGIVIGIGPTVPPIHERIVADRDNVGAEIYSSVNSFNGRTRDVLSAVGALLVGVGCGALSATTVFLMWSLFAPNPFEFHDSESDDESDVSDDNVSPKKIGYVAVPAMASPAPPPAKEVA